MKGAETITDGPVTDIAVIGGGAAGLMASLRAASAGSSVVLLDSRKEIGIPVQCGEAISENTLGLTGLERDGDWVAHSVEGFNIRSSSGDELFASMKGFSIRRDRLEKELASRASSAGAKIISSAIVERAEQINNHWVLRTGKGPISARFVILACGSNHYLPPWFGFKGVQDCFMGLGIRLARKDAGPRLTFLVRSELMGGYGWYFPRGDSVNIGVCSRSGISEQLSWIKGTFSVKDDEIVSYHGGAIPVGGPRKDLIGKACMLVGDAGGFTNPVTKGGIIGAVLSGGEAGTAAVEHLSGVQEALSAWEVRMRAHPAFSPLNIKRAEFLSSLEDGLLDEITSLVCGKDIMAVPTTELMRIVLSRPDLLKRLKKGVHLVRGGKEWIKWSF